MSNSSVANRYATALFQLAKEQNQLELVLGELRVVKQVIADNPAFIDLLKSPKLTLLKRKALIDETFASASNNVRNLIQMLVDRQRVEFIVDTVDTYITLTNEERGIEDAIVYSSRPLTNEESAAISVTFAQKVGKKSLNIENIIDSTLLGGVKIVIGNRIYDDSVSNKLHRLERTLIS